MFLFEILLYVNEKTVHFLLYFNAKNLCSNQFKVKQSNNSQQSKPFGQCSRTFLLWLSAVDCLQRRKISKIFSNEFFILCILFVSHAFKNNVNSFIDNLNILKYRRKLKKQSFPAIYQNTNTNKYTHTHKISKYLKKQGRTPVPHFLFQFHATTEGVRGWNLWNNLPSPASSIMFLQLFLVLQIHK